MKLKRAIEIQIEKTRQKLEEFQEALAKADDGSTQRMCPNCSTKNLMYNARSNDWNCAYCGGFQKEINTIGYPQTHTFKVDMKEIVKATKQFGKPCPLCKRWL